MSERVSLETLIGLDDLLEPEPTKHRLADRVPAGGDLLRWALRTGLAALALGSALWGVARLAGILVPYPLPVLTVFMIGALSRVLKSVPGASLPVVTEPLRIAHPDDGDGLADGLTLAVSDWDRSLERSSKEKARTASTVQARLRLLVDERLRLRHGVNRANDPDRARVLVGEELWRLLGVPLARTPAPRELATIVAQVEKL